MKNFTSCSNKVREIKTRLIFSADVAIPEQVIISRRSFWLGAPTRAKEQHGVDNSTIKLSNGLKKVQNSKGNVPRYCMNRTI